MNTVLMITTYMINLADKTSISVKTGVEVIFRKIYYHTVCEREWKSFQK